MKAFTIIELIFVIVIIAVLSAIAIPKFMGISLEAKKNNYLAFLGTLNRSVSPILWYNHKKDGGSIKGIPDAELKSLYTEFPEGIEAIDFSQCSDSNESLASKVGSIVAFKTEEGLYCIDGDDLHPPRFGFSENLDQNLQHN